MIYLLGDAFTRGDAKASRWRDRFAWWPKNVIVAVWGVLSGEAKITKDRDALMYVGRHGSFRALARTAAAWAITFLVALSAAFVSAFLVGWIVFKLVALDQGACAGFGVLIAIALWFLNAGRLEAKQLKHTDGPSKEERKYRTGVPRAHWLVTSLAAADLGGARALPFARSYLEKLPSTDEVVTVARDSKKRRAYGRLGFLPIKGSDWVLSRPVYLTGAELKRRRQVALALWP